MDRYCLSVDGLLSCMGRYFAYKNIRAARRTSSASTFTFTASANASNEAVVIGVNCVSTTAATGVSITATGWSFTRLGNIGFSGSSSAAVFGAISPNTTSATFTVTWTGAGNCTFHREMGDEFSGANTTGGTTTFDCGGSTCSGGSNSAHSTNGNCSVNVTTGSANEAVWGVCWPSNSVTALGSGYSAGANDGQGDKAEYKFTGDGAGTVETINFTSTTTFNAIAVAIKPAAPTTQITHSKVFAQQAGSSSASTFTFTASANAVNEAVIVGVNCVGTTAATAVSLTAPGWSFTQLGEHWFQRIVFFCCFWRYISQYNQCDLHGELDRRRQLHIPSRDGGRVRRCRYYGRKYYI